MKIDQRPLYFENTPDPSKNISYFSGKTSFTRNHYQDTYQKHSKRLSEVGNSIYM